MTRRSRDWEEGLAQDLKDLEYAQGFLLACLEEQIPLQTSIAKIIRCYGVKEYAPLLDMASSNLSRLIKANYNPTVETLNRLLKPLHLELTVKSIEPNCNKKKGALAESSLKRKAPGS